LTADEGLGSLAAVRALAAAGHQPVVGWWRSDTYAARSRAAAATLSLPDPQVDPVRHGRAIASAAEREGFAAVLPGTEPSLQALADHPVVLPPGSALGLESAGALARATDKRLLHRLASESGLDVLPQTVRDGAALIAEEPTSTFPWSSSPSARSSRPVERGSTWSRCVRPRHARSSAPPSPRLPSALGWSSPW